MAPGRLDSRGKVSSETNLWRRRRRSGSWCWGSCCGGCSGWGRSLHGSAGSGCLGLRTGSRGLTALWGPYEARSLDSQWRKTQLFHIEAPLLPGGRIEVVCLEMFIHVVKQICSKRHGLVVLLSGGNGANASVRLHPIYFSLVCAQARTSRHTHAHTKTHAHTHTDTGPQR